MCIRLLSASTNPQVTNRVVVYTDGAYSHLKDVGGCAYVAKYYVYNEQIKDYSLIKEIEGSRSVHSTTSNRMELQAVVDALRALKRPCNIEVISDSTYTVDTINKWISSMVKDPNRKNRDLIIELDNEIKKHISVVATWARGHSGIDDNERCNELAQIAAGTFLGKKEKGRERKTG